MTWINACIKPLSLILINEAHARPVFAAVHCNCYFMPFVLYSQDLMGWTKDKSEVETVDLVLKLREKLVSKLERAAQLWLFLVL